MKKWLITAGVLVIVGCIVFAGAMTAQQWDFDGLSTGKYETNHHAVSKSFQNITVVADTADIAFLPSADGKTSVTCFEDEKDTHTVSVENDTLLIELVETRQWYEYIGFYFETPKITVYLPKSEYGKLSIAGRTGKVNIPGDFTFESMSVSQTTGDVTSYASAEREIAISTNTGNIRVEGITADTMRLCVTTGKVSVANATCHRGVQVDVTTGKAELTDLWCQTLVSGGNTGDILLKAVVVAEDLTITRTTGDVTFDGADATEIFVGTETGNVTGSLLSPKIFATATETGRVALPGTTTGGTCQITTSTGDIKISIP